MGDKSGEWYGPIAATRVARHQEVARTEHCEVEPYRRYEPVRYLANGDATVPRRMNPCL